MTTTLEERKAAIETVISRAGGIGKSLPDAEVVRALLDYDAETGFLTWCARPESMFSSTRVCNIWNTRYAGKRAFTYIHTDGYAHGAIFDRVMKAHRVAWAHCYGAWPEHQLDHINHDRSDNRMANLREVTDGGNKHNLSKSLRNSSGVVGVTKHSQCDRWQVSIRSGNVARYIGLFVDFEDAVAARKAAERQYNFHPNHGAEPHPKANSYRRTRS